MGSSNSMVGGIYKLSGNLSAYIHLKAVNDELIKRNSELEIQLGQLNQRLMLSDTLAYLSVGGDTSILQKYHYIEAHAINSSVNRVGNYITLDKGRSQGIAPEMGVVDHNGVVGIVTSVSDNYAVVISLLNPQLRISCKIKESDYTGTLQWDGEDPRYATLQEVPRHAILAIGDTIVTSGYSAIFPAGVTVGTIKKSGLKENDNFYTLQIELATRFDQLFNVQVIENREKLEQRELEKKATKR